MKTSPAQCLIRICDERALRGVGRREWILAGVEVELEIDLGPACAPPRPPRVTASPPQIKVEDENGKGEALEIRRRGQRLSLPFRPSD